MRRATLFAAAVFVAALPLSTVSAEQGGSTPAQARIQAAISAVQAGDLIGARVQLDESLRLALAAEDATSVAWTVFGMGLLAHRGGDAAIAISRFKDASTRFNDLSDRNGLIQTSNMLAHVYRGLGDLTASDAFAARHLALLDAAAASAAQPLRLLGRNAFDRGENAPAEAYFQRALAARAASPADAWSAQVYGLLGVAQMRRGRLDEAASSYAESIAINEAIGAADAVAGMLVNVGGLERLRGAAAAAQNAFARAEELSAAAGRERIRAAAVSGMATLLYDARAFDDAKTLFERSLAISDRVNAPALSAKTLLHLGFTEWARGDAASARRRLDAAIDRYDAIGARDEAAAARRWRDVLADGGDNPPIERL